MNVFVTGATGVIGRRVVPLLLAQGHEVTVASRRNGRRPSPWGADVRTKPADLPLLRT